MTATTVDTTLLSGLITIDIDHFLSHRGLKFYSEFKDAGMENDDKIEMLLVTPDSDELHVHLIYGVGVTNLATLEFFKDVVTSNDGTSVTKHNREMSSDSDITADLIVKHSPTISSDGTLVQTKYAGAAGKFSAGGDDIRGINEWGLKGNTKYLLRLTANATLKGRIYINWYEITHAELERIEQIKGGWG